MPAQGVSAISDRIERRLTAILVADMVGFSAQMEADEEVTLNNLRHWRRELIHPTLKRHKGRLIKTTGDGMLVEFASVVDAVDFAVEVQQAVAKRNAASDAPEKLFRIGINLGDVVIEAGDVYGNGVNVAARLEALAEPGGILGLPRDTPLSCDKPTFEAQGRFSAGVRRLNPDSRLTRYTA